VKGGLEGEDPRIRKASGPRISPWEKPVMTASESAGGNATENRRKSPVNGPPACTGFRWGFRTVGSHHVQKKMGEGEEGPIMQGVRGSLRLRRGRSGVREDKHITELPGEKKGFQSKEEKGSRRLCLVKGGGGRSWEGD